jgi:hypothetical protein
VVRPHPSCLEGSDVSFILFYGSALLMGGGIALVLHGLGLEK